LDYFFLSIPVPSPAGAGGLARTVDEFEFLNIYGFIELINLSK
jgi:hypothetical protein